MQQVVPSLALLQAQRGQAVRLSAPDGSTVAATLLRAASGVAMNAQYRCYSAEFLLPPLVQLPQAVYRLQIGDASWQLLMTPIGPAEGQRGRLQAVFHAMAGAADVLETRDE